MTDMTGIPADSQPSGPDRSVAIDTFFQGTGKQKIVNIIGGYDTSANTGGYRIGATPIRIPHGTSIQGTGPSARFFVSVGANKPLFGINTDGNGNIQESASGASNVGPGLGNVFYRDFYISAATAAASSDMALVPAFEVANSATFENLLTYQLQTLVRSPANLYLDQLTIKKCVISVQPDGTLPAVNLSAANRVGDGLVIDQLHLVQGPTGSNRPRAVSVRNARGASITNGINGDHTFISCTSLRFSNFHGEAGKITFDGTHGVASDNIYWMRSGSVGTTPLNIVLPTNSGSSITGDVKLERQAFIYQEGNPDFVFDTTTTNLSVATGAGTVSIEDCYCTGLLPGFSGPAGKAGLKTGDPVFDRYSHFASVRSQFDHDSWLISAEHGAVRDFTSDSYLAPIGLQTGDVSTNYGLWNLATGTYYFTLMIWLDFPRRIGVATRAERNMTLTNGGGAMRFFLNSGRGPKLLRLYMGSASKSYDRYIDVPWIAGNYLTTQGDRVMGFAATSRTAGGVDADSGVQVQRYMLRPGDQQTSTPSTAYGNVTVWNYANAVPTAGFWNRGDTVLSVIPSGGKRGYQRLTTGNTHALGVDWVELTA